MSSCLCGPSSLPRAERAGLQQFDVLVSLDRHPIQTMEQVRDRVQAAKVGQAMALVVNRRGRFRLLKARLDSMPQEYAT